MTDSPGFGVPLFSDQGTTQDSAKRLRSWQVQDTFQLNICVRTRENAPYDAIVTRVAYANWSLDASTTNIGDADQQYQWFDSGSNLNVGSRVLTGQDWIPVTDGSRPYMLGPLFNPLLIDQQFVP